MKCGPSLINAEKIVLLWILGVKFLFPSLGNFASCSTNSHLIVFARPPSGTVKLGRSKIYGNLGRLLSHCCNGAACFASRVNAEYLSDESEIGRSSEDTWIRAIYNKPEYYLLFLST